MTQTERNDATTFGAGLTRVPGAFSTAAGLMATLLIAVQAVWRGSAVAGGYFTQDDFIVQARAAEQPLDFDYLTSLFAGELAPVANLLAWFFAAWTPMEWAAVTTVVILLQTVAAVLLWMVLTRLLGDRWVRLPLLAVAVFTPLTLAHTMWFSLALLHLPAVVFFLVAVLSLLARLQDGWRPGLLVATLAMALTLLSSDHTLLLPIAIFGLVAAIQDHASGVLGRIGAAIRQAGPFWIVLLTLAAGRLLLETSLVERNAAWSTDAREIIAQYVRQLVTGLVGGPWEGAALGTVFVPSRNWPIAVACVVVIALAVPFIRSRQPAARVSAIALALVLVLGGVLLVLARQDAPATSVVSRYVAMMVPVVVLLVAAGLRQTPVPPEVRPLLTRFPGIVASLLALALGVSAAVTMHRFQPALENTDDREYVGYITSALREDPRIVLLDGPTPEGVISSWFGSDARVSTVTALLPENPTFDLPSETLRIVDGFGLVRAIDLADPVVAEEGPAGDCGYAVRGRPVEIPLGEPVGEGRRVIRLGYLFGGQSLATVEAGGQRVLFRAREGLHQLEIPVYGDFDRLVVTLEDEGAALCVGSVTVGTPVPAPLLLAP